MGQESLQKFFAEGMGHLQVENNIQLCEVKYNSLDREKNIRTDRVNITYGRFYFEIHTVSNKKTHLAVF